MKRKTSLAGLELWVLEKWNEAQAPPAAKNMNYLYAHNMQSCKVQKNKYILQRQTGWFELISYIYVS